MALLYRSNAQSRVLEHALFNAALAYRVYGGMRFFERQEIKHALAYLRLIANPDDDNALLRVVNFPARGIGVRSLEQLQDDAQRQGNSLWAAMLENGKGSGKGSDRQKKGVPGFVALVDAMRQGCENLPLPEIVEHMLEHSGLTAHYRAEREGADRLENLNELINAATSFVHEAEDDTLMAFLNHASLEAGEHQAGGGQDALQLMTVHSAKGLEFHSVFLIGL
jgi:DNA helicase-2/ATP-dependent DNA helicase PcrA